MFSLSVGHTSRILLRRLQFLESDAERGVISACRPPPCETELNLNRISQKAIAVKARTCQERHFLTVDTDIPLLGSSLGRA